jgi:hypothetical protein
MRVFLVIAASLVAVASYVWFHMRYVMGVPVMLDMPFVIFHMSVPIIVVAFLVGAAVLWTNTRHMAVLLQLVSCCVMFFIFAVEELEKFLYHAEKPLLSELLRQPILELVVQIVVFLCFIAFLTGYIWYARTAKRT